MDLQLTRCRVERGRMGSDMKLREEIEQLAIEGNGLPASKHVVRGWGIPEHF